MANEKKHRTAPQQSKPKNKFKNFITKDDLLKNFKYLDWTIVIIVALLVIFGLISVFSATMYNNPLDFIITQSLSVFIGFMIIFIMLIVPYKLFEDIRLIGGAMIILIAFLILIAARQIAISGAASWIELFGFSFQPSEFVKIVSIILVSWLINYSERELILSEKNLPKHTNYYLYACLVLAIFLIFIQPDFGMVAIIGGTLGLIYLLTKGSFMANLITYGVVMLGYIVLTFIGRQFGDVLVSLEYHLFERLASFIDPFRYSSDSGYQIIQGLMAFSRGGLFGVGIGQGISKQGILPVIESDYILANIGEELGLIGVILVLTGLFSLIIILYQRAATSSNTYRKSILVGIASLMMIQTLINIGGVASVLPLTGVTLPFISYGGTSMIVMLSSIGIALRMIIEDRKEPNINLVYSKKKGE